MRQARTFATLAFVFMVFLAVNSLAVPEEKGDKNMDRIEAMEKNRQRLLGKTGASPLEATDPEIVAIRDRLIFGEIANEGSLSPKQAELVAIASLIANQAWAALRDHAAAALNAGATPLEIREAVYQIAPYVGFPRVDEALPIINGEFEKRGIKPPLENQGTVNEESRLRDGLAVQQKIFGAEHINAMREKSPVGQKQLIANYLTAYCFGDFYTRGTLDLKMRELLTFSAIVSLGGCDPQARAHAAANIGMGNSKQNLIDALAVMLPYIGFPRALNGLAAVNAAAPE